MQEISYNDLQVHFEKLGIPDKPEQFTEAEMGLSSDI